MSPPDIPLPITSSNINSNKLFFRSNRRNPKIAQSLNYWSGL